jgi:hypothetical protein
VIREFGEIGKYRIRLLGDGGRVVLDIREYVKGMSWEGFTRRGVRFSIEELRVLQEVITSAVLSAGDGNLKKLLLKETNP